MVRYSLLRLLIFFGVMAALWLTATYLVIRPNADLDDNRVEHRDDGSGALTDLTDSTSDRLAAER